MAESSEKQPTLIDLKEVNALLEERKQKLHSTEDLVHAGAECLGTFVFLYMALATAQAALYFNEGKMSPAVLLTIATGFGIALIIGISMTAKVSGGHLNPAVTAGLWATGHISATKAGYYVVAQCIGATVASYFVSAFTPGPFVVYSSVADADCTGSALLNEVFLTFVLMATVYTSAVESSMDPGFAPLFIGFSVFVIHLAGVGISGASVNPARTFGASVVSGNFVNHWLYWVGPVSGAVMAAVLFRFKGSLLANIQK